jgi:hypothetical protein
LHQEKVFECLDVAVVAAVAVVAVVGGERNHSYVFLNLPRVPTIYANFCFDLFN